MLNLFFIAAYNMVACRMGDTRNGGGISQVPLKRWNVVIFKRTNLIILLFWRHAKLET